MLTWSCSSPRGFTVPQIAAIPACGQDVVRTWLHRYEREGTAGLEDEPPSGRPPKDRAFWTDRGRPSESVPTLFGPCPDALDGLPGDRLFGRTVPAVRVLLPHSTMVAPDRLALGSFAFGACPQARSASRDQTGGAGFSKA